MPQQNLTQTQMNNFDYTNNNALQIRLDTKEILQELRLFLKGSQLVIREDPNTGKKWVEEDKISEPVVNDQGLQALMARVTMIMNRATVMGNYTEEMYMKHVANIRRSLAISIALNNKRWGIDESDMFHITETIMDALKTFLSRLIDNWERITLTPSSRATQKLEVPDASENDVFKR